MSILRKLALSNAEAKAREYILLTKTVGQIYKFRYGILFMPHLSRSPSSTNEREKEREEKREEKIILISMNRLL
jgi:hypothetical protein